MDTFHKNLALFMFLVSVKEIVKEICAAVRIYIFIVISLSASADGNQSPGLFRLLSSHLQSLSQTDFKLLWPSKPL